MRRATVRAVLRGERMILPVDTSEGVGYSLQTIPADGLVVSVGEERGYVPASELADVAAWLRVLAPVRKKR